MSATRSAGPEGASLVYGPQKGASPEVAAELDAALSRYAQVIERDLGIAVADVPGAGAAGGLGAGLIAFLGAKLRPGVELIAEAVGLPERVTGADFVLTGEGRLDEQTAYGKTPAGVARIARAVDVPVLVIAGSLAPGWESMRAKADWIEPVVKGDTALEDAIAAPEETLATATERAVRAWRLRTKKRGE